MEIYDDFKNIFSFYLGGCLFMTTYMSANKAKKLKHVKVYDRLYEMIQNQTYPPGSQLPSEPDLAAQMEVSRMTLRKALALLQEDGLIKNVRGKGNFILEPSIDTVTPSKSILHPVHHYCTETSDSVELDFRIEPPTKAISQSLKRQTPAVVIVDRWYKHKNIPYAYSLSFLPIELIGNEHLDLNHRDLLLEYLEEKIYQKSYDYQWICSHSTAGNFTATKYTLSSHESFLLIQETIYNKKHEILVSSKHYIPIQLFRIEIKEYNSQKPV